MSFFNTTFYYHKNILTQTYTQRFPFSVKVFKTGCVRRCKNVICLNSSLLAFDVWATKAIPSHLVGNITQPMSKNCHERPGVFAKGAAIDNFFQLSKYSTIKKHWRKRIRQQHPRLTCCTISRNVVLAPKSWVHFMLIILFPAGFSCMLTAALQHRSLNSKSSKKPLLSFSCLLFLCLHFSLFPAGDNFPINRRLETLSWRDNGKRGLLSSWPNQALNILLGGLSRRKPVTAAGLGR